MTPQEGLLKAASELELHGWMQSGMGTEDGPKCLVGALRFVFSGKTCGIPFDSSDYMKAVLSVRDQIVMHQLTTWNDDPGRTVEEVLDVLRKAAA